jgi:hypothetical protein
MLNGQQYVQVRVLPDAPEALLPIPRSALPTRPFLPAVVRQEQPANWSHLTPMPQQSEPISPMKLSLIMMILGILLVAVFSFLTITPIIPVFPLVQLVVSRLTISFVLFWGMTYGPFSGFFSGLIGMLLGWMLMFLYTLQWIRPMQMVTTYSETGVWIMHIGYGFAGILAGISHLLVRDTHKTWGQLALGLLCLIVGVHVCLLLRYLYIWYSTGSEVDVVISVFFRYSPLDGLYLFFPALGVLYQQTRKTFLRN